ncbi:hypothetical protein SAMN04489726_7038 [Allokutzneria albata]|uniref:Uncharacterized protein n=1 Tax=Allokutzneria albata TaxID=211114 RepID=A0A1H0C5M3_ALLAB|nr:hypothetical protein SAMN04489726_7038 [Allokutzneria albata]
MNFEGNPFGFRIGPAMPRNRLPGIALTAGAAALSLTPVPAVAETAANARSVLTLSVADEPDGTPPRE